MPGENPDQLKRILDEVVEGRRSLEQRIDGVQSRHDLFRQESLSNFDGVSLRLENLESESHAIAAGVARIERTMESDQVSRKTLSREIEKLKDRLAQLEKRLADLETDTSEPH